MKKFTLSFFFAILYSWVWGQCSTTADFTLTYPDCSAIQFTDASTASANYNLVQWQWNFGDGDTATGQTVMHTFTPGDTVLVQLVVTADSSGTTCTDTLVKQIAIHALPTVYVGSNHNPTSVVVAANFFGHSGMEPFIRSWQWDFGDGTFDTIQNPIHLYPDTGSYQVVLHVIDSNGCANENIPAYVQKVNPLSAMNFTWSVDPAAVVDNLQFTATVDTAYGNVTSWHWDFGDGDTANIQNPTHQYSTVGQYSVTLSIVVSGFSPNSLTKTITVAPLPAPDFSVSPVCLNDTTFFTDLSTTPVGTIQTWKWYFGDGDSLIINRPGNPNVKHIYGTQTVYPVRLLTINSLGYERSITKNITVVPKPLANFSFNDTCYTQPSSFFDQSSLEGGSAISSWSWNFGDTLSGAADSSHLQNPTHVISLPGTYPVRLIIENTDGCQDTALRNIVMDSLPAVEFTIPQDSICLNQKAPFYGIGKNITSWHWDFGNGDTSMYQNPVYKYPSPGLYTVTLTVKDLKGCSSSVSHNIFIKTLPQPDFTFTILCNGDTTCFLDQSSISTGYIKKWNWNFGDGSTDTIQNPTHLYKPVGQYYATLSVTSNESCTNSVSKIIIFDSLPSPDFSVSPVCLNDTTFFTDMSTTPVGTIQTLKWYFGDGDSLVVNSPGSLNVKHIYRAQTNYNVTLLAISTLGFERSITKQITVNRKPQAAFTFNDTCYTRPVSFTDLSDSAGGTSLSSWSWNFGDPVSGVADTSSLQNPTHVMSAIDTFNVRLIVKNIDGCQDTALRNVVVDSLPSVDFTMQKDSLCFGENALFYGVGKDITSWHWDFGNGDSSTFQNPVYRYSVPGLYTVTLTVKGLKGCPNTVSHKIYVIALPQPDFTTGTSCIGDSTSFIDKTSAPVGYVTQWHWDFGDTASTANQSTLENPSHLFTAINSYTVQLITVNNYGCSDTISHYVDVYDRPKPGFTYLQSCSPATEVVFSDTSRRSSSKSPIISYQWSFYQTDSSSLQNPAYRFPNYDSSYQVTLTVTDTNSCSFTDTTTVHLRDSLRIDFASSTVCSGKSTFFNASYLPGTDSIASYTWNFKDGSKSITTYHDTISHVFSQPGIYNVELSAVDTNGCSITVTHQTMVDSLPIPYFTFVTPNCDQPTYFTDSSQGGGNFVSTWQWDFGDVSSGADNYSSLTNPSHLYLSNDSLYQVKMIVTNFNGCVDSITRPVTRSSCLSVLYTASTGTGCANNAIYFIDRSILHATTGSITQWAWDFGDGNRETYPAFTDSVAHIFKTDGSYLVTLTVTVNINGMPFSMQYDSTIVVAKPPNANFTVTNACTGQTVYFTDSTETFGSALTRWQWGFDDPGSSQNSSSLQNPEHIFVTAGTYQVQLVVTDDNNCRDTAVRPVEAHPTPQASFDVNYNYNGVTGQLLMNNTTVGAVTYFWDFGDGSTSTDKDPVYRYTSVDIFHIIMIATSQYQCSDTATTVYDLTSGLYVPNSFAPGSDVPGVNIFQPKGTHLKTYHVEIFSTWGTLLWESSKLSANGEPVEGWDGTYKGKLMPVGNYVWRIKAKFLDNTYWQGSDSGDGNIKPYGTVTLIR